MNPGGFTARALFCFLAVAATWNPTGISYVAWVASGKATLPEACAAGSFLFGLHLLLARSAVLALGLLGTLAVLAGLGSGALALAETSLFAAWRPLAMAYGPLVAISAVLSAGLTWSIVKRRLLGQSNVINPPP